MIINIRHVYLSVVYGLLLFITLSYLSELFVAYIAHASITKTQKLQKWISFKTKITDLVAAMDARCLSFFSREHSPHQFEKSFWYFFISLKTELYRHSVFWRNKYLIIARKSKVQCEKQITTSISYLHLPNSFLKCLNLSVYFPNENIW